jgi:hypothetical protein
MLFGFTACRIVHWEVRLSTDVGFHQCGDGFDAIGARSPAMQIQQYDNSTFIIRQNKCINYEAAFLYLLFGSNRALLVDTG